MIPDIDNDSLCYLNGDYLRLGDAKVSVLDRGFIYGDGIYDVVPAYEGRPFRQDHHLARLERSLAAIHIRQTLTRAQWETVVQRLLEPFGGRDAAVYLQVTRGVYKRDHAFPPASVEPTLFAMAYPFKRPTPEMRENGQAVITIPDVRWQLCDIKSISLLGNLLAKQRAVEAGVDEVIQFRDGVMTEGASCNIWLVKNNTLMAPPRSHHILEGIRYGFMEELARDAGIAFQARELRQEDVEQADELMLTSATREVLPITRVNGQPVGQGTPGPVYRALRAGYDAAILKLSA